MRNLIAIFLATLAISAQARSLDPCTPRIEAAPSQLFCFDGTRYYTIHFHTLMSGRECPEHREITSATIDISTKEEPRSQVSAGPGSFTYSLFDGRFDSDELGLHLKNCIAPVHGGFSIGN